MPMLKRTSLRKNIAVTKKAEGSWRESRMFVAAASVGATVTLMGSVVTPLVTAHLTSKIEIQQALIKSSDDKIASLNARIDDLENKANGSAVILSNSQNTEKSLREKIRQHLIESPFYKESPYPKDLDLVRVGDDIAKLHEKYPNAKIANKYDQYYSIEIEHPIFDPITFYFSERTRKITHILFHLRFEGPIEKGDVKNILNRTFGSPAIEHQGNSLWAVTSREMIDSDGDSFVIYGRGIYPRWLTKGIDSGAIKIAKPTHPPSDGGQKEK